MLCVIKKVIRNHPKSFYDKIHVMVTVFKEIKYVFNNLSNSETTIK